MIKTKGGVLNLITAATVAVDTDLISSERLRQSSVHRTLKGISFTGGSAANDSVFELEIDGEHIAKIRNTATGVYADNSASMLPVEIKVPAKSELTAIVTDALPAACQLIMIFE